MQDLTRMTIYVRSHHFLIRGIHPSMIPLLDSFYKRYTEVEWVRFRGRWMRTDGDAYAWRTERRTQYRFHIHALGEFKRELEQKQVFSEYVKWVEQPPIDGFPAEFTLNPKFQPRENQPIVIDYMRKPWSEISTRFLPATRLVTLQTGKGKTFLAAHRIAELQQVVLLCIAPKYFEKWTKDFETYFGLDKKDICWFGGGSNVQLSVRAVLTAARKERRPYKVYFFSHTTMRNFLAAYTADPVKAVAEWGASPDEMFRLLGIGIKIVDEVHQEYHTSFITELMTNVKESVSLTATLLSDDGFTRRMHELMFPIETRMPEIDLHRYIHMDCLGLRARAPNFLVTEERNGRGWSQNALEASLYKHVPTRLSYFRMITDQTQEIFMRQKRSKKRALILMFRIESCTMLVEHLRKHFPELKIARYVEDDTLADTEGADIIVSTYQSAGTAIDFPDLTWVFMTIVMRSMNGNVQIAGRLRYLPDYDSDEGRPVFTFVNWVDVEKSKQITEAKFILFRDRVYSTGTRMYNKLI